MVTTYCTIARMLLNRCEAPHSNLFVLSSPMHSCQMPARCGPCQGAFMTGICTGGSHQFQLLLEDLLGFWSILTHLGCTIVDNDHLLRAGAASAPHMLRQGLSSPGCRPNIVPQTTLRQPRRQTQQLVVRCVTAPMLVCTGLQGYGALELYHPVSSAPTPLLVECRAEARSSGGGFFAGFVVGGALFGALGFLFAPQVCLTIMQVRQVLECKLSGQLLFGLSLSALEACRIPDSESCCRYPQHCCQKISDSSCPDSLRKKRRIPKPPNRHACSQRSERRGAMILQGHAENPISHCALDRSSCVIDRISEIHN